MNCKFILRHPISGLRVPILLLSVIGLLLAPPLQSSAEAVIFTLSKVAAVGDSAPGTAGGQYTSSISSGNIFGRSVIDNNGRVAFTAFVAGGTATQGVFLDTAGIDAAMALQGQVAPDAGGSVYATLVSTIAIDNQGRVAVGPSLSGGSITRGLFRLDGSAGTAVALGGQAAPGTSGGTFSSMSTGSMADNGRIVFVANVSGGTSAKGIFLADAGSITPIALRGQPAPGAGAATYFDFNPPPVVNAQGEILFYANLTGGPPFHGLFLYSNGSVMKILLQGETAPGTGGGTFGQPQWPDLNNFGNAAFINHTSGGTSPGGIFLVSQGQIQAVVYRNEVAPGTGGKTISSFRHLEMNDLGDLVFTVFLNDTNTAMFFRDHSTGVISPVALPGQAAPGLPGRIFTAFFWGGDLNSQRQIALDASLSDGTNAIFLATPDGLVPIPAISARGAAASVLLLLTAGAAILRRRAVSSGRVR